MTIDKEHLEFHAVDMDDGWHTLPGYPPARIFCSMPGG